MSFLPRSLTRRIKADKSELKTNLKKFDAALVSGDKAAADAAYKTAVKAVDQAVNNGLLHKNNAARKKEQHDSEAEQAGLISLKISPSEQCLEGVFSFCKGKL